MTRQWRKKGQIPLLDLSKPSQFNSQHFESNLAWSIDANCLLKNNKEQWHAIDEASIIEHLVGLQSRYVSDNHRRVPCGVFVSDDGALDDYKLLGPVCSEKSVPFVLAIVRDFVGSNHGVGYMDLNQLREMEKMGCELVGHTLSHPGLATLNSEQNAVEILGSVEWMREQGWKCRHFVYPYGSHSTLSEHAAGKLCDTACIVTGGVANPPFFRTRVPRQALGSFFHRGIKSFSAYQALVDEAVQSRRMLVWMLHPWSDQHDVEQQSLMLDVIDYMRDQGMEICDMTDAWKIHGNLWESQVGYGGEWIIDCDGTVWHAENTLLGFSQLINYTTDRIVYKKLHNKLRTVRNVLMGKP